MEFTLKCVAPQPDANTIWPPQFVVFAFPKREQMNLIWLKWEEGCYYSLMIYFILSQFANKFNTFEH